MEVRNEDLELQGSSKVSRVIQRLFCMREEHQEGSEWHFENSLNFAVAVGLFLSYATDIQVLHLTLG